MPATEQTWRDTKKLHFWFGVTSVILLFSTIWMFVKDFTREWKDHTSTFNNVELRATKWRTFQFQSDRIEAERDRLTAKLQQIRGRGLDPDGLSKFKSWATGEEPAGAADKIAAVDGGPDFAAFDAAVESLAKASAVSNEAANNEAAAQLAYDQANLKADDAIKKAGEAKQAADAAAAAAAADPAKQAAADAAATALKQAETAVEAAKKSRDEAIAALASATDASREADEAAKAPRDEVVDFMQSVIDKAVYNETRASQERKFRSARLDAAVANLGMGVRDGLDESVMTALQDKVTDLKGEVSELNSRWEDLKKQREAMEKLLQAMTTEEDAVLAAIDENEAGIASLQKAQEALRVSFVEDGFLPGKRLLALPILEAFNSPLKIDNRWADGLEQTYGSFGNVRRFDRCTSCHRGMEKTMPGSATDPAYLPEHSVKLVLSTDPPEGVDLTPPESAKDDLQKQIALVSAVYGLHFANEGLVERNDVTVAYVRSQSLGAQAAVWDSGAAKQPAEEIQAEQLRLQKTHDELLPGLRVGDVVASIASNGDSESAASLSQERVVARLADAVGTGESLVITVKRGLKHPYSTHPRLDLFVGSLSPHKVTDFACTICHEGQGSATEFKWASHTPNNAADRKRWTRDNDWFDNHHWIFPMNPNRFVESVCLKCHHNVVELRPSEQFAEAPAPKLMKGYDLIMKYGCYGCHEVNGWDGGKSIGPDLRSEPNFFAGALQLQSAPNFDQLPEDLRRHVADLARHPGDNTLRHNVLKALEVEQSAEAPKLDPARLTAAINALKDVESPGKLRKPGPSLRYLGAKSDSKFVYDWINKPANFRPSTRMPQFFGHWNHLDDKSKEISELLEPAEAMAATSYLLQFSQEHEYLTPPEGISESTPDEKIARGKVQFEERGCLACHSHGDFPDVAKYRAEGQIQQGPDLTGIGSKFDPARNPNGRKWLYSWIKEPTRYHARTVMPNLYLDPMEIKQGDKTIVVDPADDITEYLMASENEAWHPVEAPNFEADAAGLDALVKEHLKDAFIFSEVEQVLKFGVPQSRAAELKLAERELLVPENSSEPLSVDQKLRYAGLKTIAKFGCYGCHDIPGFEEAKPIGAGLADWGRKDPSKLAFEHINEYLHHGHGHGGDGEHGGHEMTREEAAEQVGNVYSDKDAAADDSAHGGHDDHGMAPGDDESMYEEFYKDQLHSGNRMGFIYQKLREPRSYDYHKTRNKKYNDRLRMPLFPFTEQDREAVITFVLGLVADPPNDKYIYKPSKRSEALIAGAKVLEKYNCKGCHMLEPQKWSLEFGAGEIRAQTAGTTYPFVLPQYMPEEVAASKQLSNSNKVRAELYGMPRLLDQGPPRILDEGDPIERGEEYAADRLDYTFSLWKSSLVDGNSYIPGETPKTFPSSQIHSKSPADGGDLARYLISRVGKRARQENPNTKVGEIWGWLPPPLHHEGEKVQTEWLHNFLLEPYPIRPATVLRMPKFNMSPSEATKLVNYFAAKNNVEYPYSYSARKDPSRLEQLDKAYREANGGEPGERLRHAMQIVTSGSYCVKCHHVADARSSAGLRAQAPNLADVYQRLRPDYLRQWIAKPNSYLPYTAMPVNVPYDAEKPFLGSTVPQDLYHGTSVEQLDGLVDLLMNYDQYTRQETKVGPMVKAAAAKQPPAGGAAGGEE